MKPTPIEKLRKAGPRLKSPFEKLGNLQFSSWVNDVLPDVLWSALIATLLPRHKAIEIFRIVARNVKRNADEIKPRMLVHSQMASIEERLFDGIFEEICSDQEVNKVLSPLLSVESLPDKSHWSRHVSDLGPEIAGSGLAMAVAECFNHQSQAATDCRWLRVMTLFAQDRMVFDQSMSKRVEDILKYPDMGDMREVRPQIRSLEMATRAADEKLGAPYNEQFWDECWKTSDCIIGDQDDYAPLINRINMFEEIKRVDDDIASHFINTIKTTKIDARHDAAFGLVLYISHLLMICLVGPNGQTMIGRVALRSAVEIYITLSYLCFHDNATIWMQFRNYGNGQNKLAFLKSLKEKEFPEFISKDTLEQYANEDMWQEYLDIKLGAWDGKDLRKMSIEAGVKEVYDRYYDILSGYVHGNWMAVRHAVFGQCLNPLHRFHRVPLPPRSFVEDAVPDLIKILNLSLDRLNSLYSPFKARVHADKLKPQSAKAHSAKPPSILPSA